MSFEKHKEILNKELDRFNILLGEILPRYIHLVRKSDTTPEETKELGEIEHFLIDINSKIAAIKSRIDQDLFGEAMDIYYKVKAKALKGDLEAKEQLDKLRESLSETIKGDAFFNWN